MSTVQIRSSCEHCTKIYNITAPTFMGETKDCIFCQCCTSSFAGRTKPNSILIDSKQHSHLFVLIKRIETLLPTIYRTYTHGHTSSGIIYEARAVGGYIHRQLPAVIQFALRRHAHKFMFARLYIGPRKAMQI